MEKKYYKIGEVSKLCQIAVRTLHYYNEIGLIVPERIDEVTNYRFYTASNIQKIGAIKFYKDAGFSLKEIQVILERVDLAKNQQMLELKKQELEKQIEQLITMKNRLALFNEDLVKDSQEMILKEIPYTSVAFFRETAPATSETFPIKYTKLLSLIKKHKLTMTRGTMEIYYDDFHNYNPLAADIEMCAPIIEKANQTNQSYIRQFGGFLALSARHYGPYAKMSETYAKMLQWIETYDYVFLGNAVNIQLIDISQTIFEHEFVTEILLPVRKRQVK